VDGISEYVIFEGWNGSDDLALTLATHCGDTTNIRFLISESGSNRFRSYCLSQAPRALWGCCLTGFIAVEYAPENARLVTLLHESLHLFDVDECYDEVTHKKKDTCTGSTCLMQYGVVSTDACSNAISQIRS
jgi:hypothetical protein